MYMLLCVHVSPCAYGDQKFVLVTCHCYFWYILIWIWNKAESCYYLKCKIFISYQHYEGLHYLLALLCRAILVSEGIGELVKCSPHMHEYLSLISHHPVAHKWYNLIIPRMHVCYPRTTEIWGFLGLTGQLV